MVSCEMIQVPEDFKVSPGGVECLRCLNQDQCIVGYQRGILVLFDLSKLSAKQTYISRKDLSSIHIVDDCKFVSCHTDGGYAVWSTILSSSTKQVRSPMPISFLRLAPVDSYFSAALVVNMSVFS